ncbi:MAG TPA: hypothetical protein VF086_10825 [Propionibacteriaceae bacterium]
MMHLPHHLDQLPTCEARGLVPDYLAKPVEALVAPGVDFQDPAANEPAIAVHPPAASRWMVGGAVLSVLPASRRRGRRTMRAEFERAGSAAE